MGPPVQWEGEWGGEKRSLSGRGPIKVCSEEISGFFPASLLPLLLCPAHHLGFSCNDLVPAPELRVVAFRLAGTATPVPRLGDIQPRARGQVASHAWLTAGLSSSAGESQ